MQDLPAGQMRSNFDDRKLRYGYSTNRSQMSKVLQYAPFGSALDVGFWHKLSDLKLDVYGLDDQPKPIHGFYTNGTAAGLPCHLNIDYNAFDESAKTPPRCFPAHGFVQNMNTLDDFRNCEKKALLDTHANTLWEDITSGRAVEDPSLLVRLLLLTFADLKKYHNYYWFAFPALCPPESVTLVTNPVRIERRFSKSQIEDLIAMYDDMCLPNHVGFFLAVELQDRLQVGEIKQFRELHEMGKVILCISDPCTLETNPGWPLRNLLTLAGYHWSDALDEVEVLCFRDRVKGGNRQVNHSIVFTVKLTSLASLTECPKSVGWEKNERQKSAFVGPRMVNLSASMNPYRLAESAVDLNLKLMRWRLMPELDLDVIARTRCLLLGAGTLGCNIARNLIGWGVRTLTLVDNSRVSYSNPVRQTLFNFEDSLNGGKPKALVAAESLKKIFPGVTAEGVVLSIPMPGHPSSGNREYEEETRKEVALLEELIEKHDVVFLLMDTRESRWLPTLIGAAKQKIVMTAALGFDTFLILRHGLKGKPQELEEVGDDPMSPGTEARSLPLDANIPGHLLGCYFCNDVVAPGDSTRDRTLDQQCTVSRPGMSFMTSAIAVELLVTLLQHPLGGFAPADTSARDEHLTKDTVSPLGLVPHQIRGFLSRFHNLMPASRAYEKCTACSQTVIDAYLKDGFKFLQSVFDTPSYLEDLTGLSKLHAETQDAEVWELSDDESV